MALEEGRTRESIQDDHCFFSSYLQSKIFLAYQRRVLPGVSNFLHQLFSLILSSLFFLQAQ